jgi:Carboxypeptidase regulatory-like domain
VLTQVHDVTISALVLAAGLLLQSPAAPQRDAPAAAKPGGGTIRGRVVAAATRQPLHRVRITLRASDPNAPATVTDTRGQFELRNVPPGSYTLTAARAGYLTIQYGQRRPRESGRTFDIKAGDVLAGIDLAMYKGGVISGRITDEANEPAPNVRVEAVEMRYMRGRRVPVAAKIATTNDAGEYRLSGLDPGQFQVRASSTDVWESDDGKNTYVYALTYFPGVTAGERPESVTVALGQEVGNTDLRLVPGPAARITGLLVNAAGEPMAGEMIALDRVTRTTGGALSSAGFGGSTRTDARGAFEFPKLATGEFMVYSGAQTNRVSLPVVLNPGETRSVTLTPRPPTAIAGNIRSDDGSAVPFAPGRLRIDPIVADPESVLPVWGAPRGDAPRPDWAFRVAGVNGAYLFRVTGLPEDWAIHAVTLGDRDYTDTPLAVAAGAPDVTGVQIVLTHSGAKVSGTVTDAAGAPAPDASVILFAEEPARWGLASRYIKVARPDNAGKFIMAGILPGVYRAVAREAVADGQWEDAEFLQALIKDSVRVDLAARADETLKLTLGPPR